MAKKTTELNFIDIVLNADADTIRQALEARVQIDGLLSEREEAYRKIAELEEQIESVIGEEGAFPFPSPPLPVAGIADKDALTRKTAKKSAKPATARKTAADKSGDDEADTDAENEDSSDDDSGNA